MARMGIALRSFFVVLPCFVIPYVRGECCEISCIKHLTFDRCDISDPNLECPKQEYGTCSCYWNPSAEKCYANTYKSVGVNGGVIAIMVAVLFFIMLTMICCYYRKRMKDEDKRLGVDGDDDEEAAYHDGPQGGPQLARGSNMLQRAKKKVGFLRRASILFAGDVQQTARSAHRRASDIFTILHANNPAKPEINTVSYVQKEELNASGTRPLTGGRRGSLGSIQSGIALSGQSGYTRQSEELRAMDPEEAMSPASQTRSPFHAGGMGGSQRNIKKVDDIFNVLHGEDQDEENRNRTMDLARQVSGENVEDAQHQIKRNSSIRTAQEHSPGDSDDVDDADTNAAGVGDSKKGDDGAGVGNSIIA